MLQTRDDVMNLCKATNDKLLPDNNFTGVEAYNHECRSTVSRYVNEWEVNEHIQPSVSMYALRGLLSM